MKKGFGERVLQHSGNAGHAGAGYAVEEENGHRTHSDTLSRLELSRSRSVARPRQLQRSVGQRRAIENERNRRATTEPGRLPVTR